MQADINGNPILIEFEEFKKLDLFERRQVLFDLLVEMLPLLEKMATLEETLESLTSRVEKVEDQLLLKSFQFYIPKEIPIDYTTWTTHLFTPSASNIIDSRKTSKRVILNIGGTVFQREVLKCRNILKLLAWFD